MHSFTGTHENRLDAKGRVSVPAPFRAALRNGGDVEAPTKLMLRRSHTYSCYECWPVDRFQTLARSLDALDPLSDEYQDRAVVIYGDTIEVELDREGRIVLTPTVIEHVGAAERVAFMGMGATFHLWEPDALKRRQDEARAGARQRNSARPA